MGDAWGAMADDGRGHTDGDMLYTVHVPVEHFGPYLFLGGDARWTNIFGNADSACVYRLPEVAPAPGHAITFKFKLDPNVAVGGRMVCVSGLQVRAPPRA